MERKPLAQSLWLAAQPILVYFGASFGLGALLSAGAVAADGLLPGLGLLDLLLVNLMWVQVAIQLVCLPALLALYRPRRAALPRYARGAGLTALPPVLLGSVALWFVVSPVVELLAPLFPSYDAISELVGGTGIGLFVLSVGLLAPVVEELCFRGVAYNALRGALPVLPAVVAQALLFGLIHMNPLQTIYATLVGLAFGLVYARLPMLWVPILAHACFNLTNLLAGVIPGLSLLGSLLGGGVALALCVVWLLRLPAPVPLYEAGFYCLRLGPKRG